MSEAGALEDWSDEGMLEDWRDEPPRRPAVQRVRRVSARKPTKRAKKPVLHTGIYLQAAKVGVGGVFMCPGCGKDTLKETYQQKFCSNKGHGNCKDWYWNLIRGVK